MTGVIILSIQLTIPFYLRKLKNMDSLVIPLYWFRSNLLNRQQLVSCHNKLSRKRQLNIGFPQGSVLGPILFLIYVNDINMHVDLGACNLYADDTLVYCSANNINELQECTQKCVTAIKDWYDNNHLVINASKSSIMAVTTKQRDAFNNLLKISTFASVLIALTKVIVLTILALNWMLI